jgi:AraC-like DNA-binding protein
MGQSLGPSETFALARHIIDLAALCVGAHRDAEEMAARRGLASARFDAIKADVLNQVADSSIRLAQVADRHHISERYVQQLFELAGTSFSGFVLAMCSSCSSWRHVLFRLCARAAARAGPEAAARPEPALAQDQRYCDGIRLRGYLLLHRALRSRFGARPSDVRAANNCELVSGDDRSSERVRDG